jgi:tetratricopeptide (TPR) repeat protein
MLTSVELDTHQGRYVKVREVLEKILPEIRASGDRHILGRALGHLGRIAMWQDDPGAARYLGEALELTRESGDKLALSFVLRRLGNVTMDDPTTSRTYLEESLALAQQLGNRGVEAQALNSLGNLHLSNLDQVRAEEYYRRCMALSRETKESFAGLIAESNLGAAQILGGDYEKARRTLEHVLQRVQELGDRSLEPSVFETLGWLELHLKNHDAARKWLEQSLAGMREQAAKPLTVIILFAVLEARSGRKIDALEWVACVRAQTTLSRSIFEIYIHDHLEEMTAGLSPGEVEAAFARGAAMSLDDVLRRIESGA